MASPVASRRRKLHPHSSNAIAIMSTTTQTQTVNGTPTESYPIKVYNTLSKKKETFEPVQAGRVGIYLCGPTVYKEAHIGHLVGPVIFDTVARYLRYCGYDVTWVVNITDVDDKLIAESQRRDIPMSQVATQMTSDYCANLLEVGIDQISAMPKATEHIQGIIQFIEELIEAGYAYEADGDVFFEVSKDAEYGKLTNRNAEEQQGGGGGAAAKKRASGDFALWKGAKSGEPSWDSSWGPGRPGWHIECSAMSRELLGNTFDIHGGGLDLTFPHHENEIAQSECCHSAPMAKYWMHNGLLRRGEESGKLGGRSERDASEDSTVNADEAASKKMSRSQGAGGLRDLLGRHGGERVRFFLVRTHYRSTILYSEEGLNEAGTALDKFYVFFERYERIMGRSFYLADGYDDESLIKNRAGGEVKADGDELLTEVATLRSQFLSKMDDDFNTGGAMSELFQLLSLLNRYGDEHKLDDAKADAKAKASFARAVETLRELAAILGLFIKPPATAGGGDEELVAGLMELMIELRAQARSNKDFATADKIRDGLQGLNLTIEDRKEGTLWRMG